VDPDPELLAALAELEGRDNWHRERFSDAAGRDLPPKARARLTQALEAYQAGHGRLLSLVRRMTGGPGGGRTRPGTPWRRPLDLDLVREGRALLGRMREASRPEPLSSGELKVRAPELQAPPLAAGTDGAREALEALGDQGPIGSVPGILKAAAQGLGSPVAVYEWVRNQVAPEFYYGSMKGPVQTYLEGSGNDADTASVLVFMLRALGIPARYVRGTVRIPGDALRELTGTESIGQAVRVLERPQAWPQHRRVGRAPARGDDRDRGGGSGQGDGRAAPAGPPTIPPAGRQSVV